MRLELKFVLAILMRFGQMTLFLSCQKTAPDALGGDEVARDFDARVDIQYLLDSVIKEI